jgi:hypothetical protein
LGAKLVTADLTYDGAELIRFYRPSAITPITQSGGFRTPRATDNPFTRLETSTLNDAVAAASTLSVLRKYKDIGISPAVAVLQAKDGSYFATHLRFSDNKADAARTLSIDLGSHRLQINDLYRPHPDLRAIAGSNSWVDFSASQAATPSGVFEAARIPTALPPN